MGWGKDLLKNALTLGASNRLKKRQKVLKEMYKQYEESKNKMHNLHNYVNENLNNLIEYKKEAFISLKRVEKLFVSLSLSDYKILEKSHNNNIKSTNVKYIGNEINEANAKISSAVGVAGGMATSFGAYTLVSTFGIASTGTFIGTLSGAALHNATLAALGGGSLAVGGGGMAAGVATLGWLFAVPAVAITGFTMNKITNLKIDEVEKTISEIYKARRKINDQLVVLNNLSIDVHELHIDEYIEKLSVLTSDFEKIYQREFKTVYKYPLFSKLRKYIRKIIFRKNYYSEKDLISISKISKKAEELINYMNLQLNKVNNDLIIENNKKKNKNLIKEYYDFEEIKAFIFSRGLKEKKIFIEEFSNFIDNNQIQRNLPKNMIYQFIALFFIYKKAQSEKKFHIINIVNSYDTFRPLYSTKKSHEKIEEINVMKSFEYSQVYWYCKNNFEWIFDMMIFDPDKNEYQNLI